MGRRGPKAKPTALHVLRGNPGRRPLNVDEPQLAPLSFTDLPDEIAALPVACAEWQRIVPGLAACGQVTIGDRAAVIGYCVKYAHWREHERIAADEPYLLKGERGTVVHPAVKQANQSFLIFLRAAVELGLTPSSRSRIVAVKPAAPRSKWSGALK